MTYDDHAKLLGVKTIGTVESNLQWDSINYSDPITVGFVQWFGTRAAAILVRMKQTNSWSGVRPSIDNDLNNVPASNASFWESRYLTAEEGASLAPVLTACANIQSDQLIQDMEVYKGVAVSYGMDPDTDTQAMLFFFVVYHQGPVYALQVLDTTGPHPTLTQIRDATLAHPVLGGYATRYNDAYDLITANDTSGVPDPSGPSEPPNPGGGGPGSNTTLNIKYAESVGDHIHLHMGDGQIVQLYSDGRNRFLPRQGSTTEPSVPGTPPTGGGGGNWVDPLPTGVFTSGYGLRDASIGGDAMHWGMDESTPGYAGDIYAPCDMIVTAAGYGLGSFNNSAGWRIVAHTLDDAYTFTFNHMQYGSLTVAAGDTVTQSTKIGVEGATGNVTGRHLHIEVYEGKFDNPWPPPYGPTPIDPRPVFAAHGVNI